MRFSGKKLLMLGTSVASVDIVKYAQANGAYVIVTDYLPTEKSEAKQIADETAMVSTIDAEAVVQLAKEKQVDGVFCGVSEANLVTVQTVCERLGLPCYSNLELWSKCQDKEKFKSLCRQFGVPVVEEYEVPKDRDLNSIKKIHLPVVVKPVDSSGSRGISVCKTEEELLCGIEKALAFSQSKHLLIEKYMTGEEVVIYYAFQEGEPILTAMCDRYTNKEQEGVAQLPTSYVFPSRHLKRYIQETDAKVKNMLRGIGIKNGTMFIQAFVDEDGGVRIYETGFRLNGAQEHFIVNATTGINTLEMMVNYSLNGKMCDERIAEKADPMLHGKYACKLSPLVKEGVISRIVGLKEIQDINGIICLKPLYQPGDTVSGIGTLKQIACRFFAAADSAVELKQIIDKINDLFDVIDETGKSMLLSKFDTTELERYFS